MASDSDCDESAYTAEAISSAEEETPQASRRKQQSIPDCLRQMSGKLPRRKPKRLATPPESNLAKRQNTQAGESALVGLSTDSLSLIQEMIESATTKMIEVFNTKFLSLEKRLEILEAENFEKDQRIKQMEETLASQHSDLQELHAQVESIDANRRLSSLILTSRDFEPKFKDEDMALRAIEALNKRLPGLDLAPTDVSIAHRLQADDKVIVKFVRRSVRDKVFDRRFELFSGSSQGRGEGAPSSQRPSEEDSNPLYMQESLTATKSKLYHELVRARKPANGAIIASVFSRKGEVLCRKEKYGTNIHIYTEEDLVKVLGGRRFPPQPRGGGYGVSRGRHATRDVNRNTASAGASRAPQPPSRASQPPDSHRQPPVSAPTTSADQPISSRSSTRVAFSVTPASTSSQ